jgi:hypothetical protein
MSPRVDVLIFLILISVFAICSTLNSEFELKDVVRSLSRAVQVRARILNRIGSRMQSAIEKSEIEITQIILKSELDKLREHVIVFKSKIDAFEDIELINNKTSQSSLAQSLSAIANKRNDLINHFTELATKLDFELIAKTLDKPLLIRTVHSLIAKIKEWNKNEENKLFFVTKDANSRLRAK